MTWTREAVAEWYARYPWLIGCNYCPRTAINQLEMWQADTFDPDSIRQELGWARHLGLNAIRVFLHDLVWRQDPSGFKGRFRALMGLAEQDGISILPVFFDDCHNKEPRLGKQPDPKPGLHNSGWMQSPGEAVRVDPTQWSRLEDYVKDMASTFGDDPRVLLWDVYRAYA